MSAKQLHPDGPGLWRLAPAASRAGMTPKTFAAACAAGEIPVTVLRLGPRRMRYVRAAELEAFLADGATPANQAEVSR